MNVVKILHVPLLKRRVLHLGSRPPLRVSYVIVGSTVGKWQKHRDWALVRGSTSLGHVLQGYIRSPDTSSTLPKQVYSIECSHHEVLPLLRHHRVRCAWTETSDTMSQCSVISGVCWGPSSFQVGFLRSFVIATKPNTEMVAGSIADAIKIKGDVTLQPSSILLVYKIRSHI